LRKQDRRQTSATDGTDRPDWSTAPRYSATPPRWAAKSCGSSSTVFKNPPRRRSMRPGPRHSDSICQNMPQAY